MAQPGGEDASRSMVDIRLSEFNDDKEYYLVYRSH